MNKRNSWFKNEKGQSIVEFALILPLLLTLLLGLIEFGWIFSAQVTITNAARVSARVAAISGGPPSTDYQVAAIDAMNIKAITNPSVSVPVIGPVSVEGTTTNMAVVTVRGDVKTLTHFFDQWLFGGDKITLSATAKMRIEYKLP